MKNFIKLIIFLITLFHILACAKDKSLEYYHDKMLSYYDSEEYEKAIEIGNVMKNKYPQKALPYQNLAYVYFEKKEYEKAKKLLLLAIEKYQQYDILAKKSSIYSLKEAYYLLARTYEAQGDKLNAIKFYDKTISIDSTKVKAFAHLAINYAYLKKYKKAINYVNKAIQYCRSKDELDEMYDLMVSIIWSIDDYNSCEYFINAELRKSNDKYLRKKLLIVHHYNLYRHGYFNKQIKESSKFINKEFYDSIITLFRGLSFLRIKNYKKAIYTFNLRKENDLLVLKKDVDAKFIILQYNIEMMLTYLLMNNRNLAKVFYKKIGMKKEELLNSNDFKDAITIICTYKPYKELLIKFINSQIE